MADEGNGSSNTRTTDPAASTHQARASSSRISYARQRAIRACQLCRAKRIKCDNEKPTCSSCERVGADCVRADADGNFLDAGSLQILQRIDDLEGLVKTLLLPHETVRTAPFTLDKTLASRRENVRGMPLTEQQTRQLRITTEEVLSWSVFQKHYDSRCDLKALLRTRSAAPSAFSPMSIDSFFLTGDVEHNSPQRMLDNFLHSVHVKNPMLDENKIKQLVNRMSLEGPTWNADCCLALIVCALGSVESSFDPNSGSSDPPMEAVAESYFNAAQRRLGMFIGSGGVLEAQCFFYSGVYLMNKLQPLGAWRLFCQALACCQEFACADPSYQDHLTRISSANQILPAEECVYWSCWKSELELRKLLGLPDFAFSDLSYPLLFPTPPESIQGQQAASWYFYLSEISLRRLEHRVRDEISNALGASESFCTGELLAQTTRAVEGLADGWAQSLPAAMSLHTSQAEDDVLKFILRGHLLDLWEVVYWPWLDLSINQHVFTPEVKNYVVRAFQVAIDRIRINKPGFHHRHHGTWLMLQSCTRSALILLAAAYVPDAAALLPHGWRDAVLEATELLRFWQYDAGDTADRLQILEELRTGIDQNHNDPQTA
jgi:hypothetical protein